MKREELNRLLASLPDPVPSELGARVAQIIQPALQHLPVLYEVALLDWLAARGFGVSVLMRGDRWGAVADGPGGYFQAFNGESRFAALCQVARQIALKGAGK